MSRLANHMENCLPFYLRFGDCRYNISSTNFEQYLQDVLRSEKALPANAGTSRQYGLTDINDHSEAFVMRFALAACIKPIVWAWKASLGDCRQMGAWTE